MILPPAPPKLPLVQAPTEFRLLERVSEHLGGPKIWLKSDDLTGSLLSGNKVRKLAYLLADAKASGCDTIITCGGLQSNHCRATAAMAARLGMACHLILRGERGLPDTESTVLLESAVSELDGNLLLDTLLGAEITVVPPKKYFSSLDQIFQNLSANYQAQGRLAYCIPTGGSNGYGLWGYLNAFEELVEDFERNNITPRAIICATGSGGTQGGLSLGAHLLKSEAEVIGVAVCDSAQYFESKIRSDVAEWQSLFAPNFSNFANDMTVTTWEDYIGPGYAQGYPELFETIAWLARTEGVVLDPVYTGKAFHGLCQEIHKGRFSQGDDVVFVHTGGIYGLFPFKNAWRA